MVIMSNTDITSETDETKTLEAGALGRVTSYFEANGKGHVCAIFGAELWVLEVQNVIPMLSLDEFAKQYALTSNWTSDKPPCRDTVSRWIHEHGLRAHQVQIGRGRPAWRIPQTELRIFVPPKPGPKVWQESTCPLEPCDDCDRLTRARCYGEGER